MENKLKYTKSAGCFEEALPIGNGSLGAMVYGRHEIERVSLNHDTLWCGKPQHPSKPKAYEAYAKARELALKGELKEASDIIAEELSDTYGCSYLPAGNLYIRHRGASKPECYYRELDMESGIVTVRYISGGVSFKREYFISYPDNCIVVRIESDKPCSYEIEMDSLVKHSVCADGGQIMLCGECPSKLAPHYALDNTVIEYDGDGIHFTAISRIVSDGDVSCAGGTVTVENSTKLTVFTCIESSFIDFNTLPTKECRDVCISHADEVVRKGFDTLRADHTSDFSSYYNRVKLDLGFAESDLTTDERIRAENKDEDLGLVELLFNFGRYLMITSSRPGSEATNLQGIWNEQLQPPWSCNYTVNINTQMNYWPAFMCNLAEMNKPLEDLVRKISVTGAVTAKELYGAEGFCCHSNIDLWGRTAMGGENNKNCICYAFWNMSAAWFCRHLWEKYEYTLDEGYLRETAYPLMKEAAKFLLSVLVEDNGRYIVCPSSSPENKYYYHGEEMGLAKYTTMTQAITMDLFGNVSRAAEILGIEDDFVCKVREKLPKLNTYAVGSEGQLLEYDEDFEEVDVHHRHVSHLYGLYPGESISVESTPELAEACRQTLIRRGDFSTGWAMGWRINLWAKLKDGDHALELIKNQLRFVEGNDGKISYGADGGTYVNLFDAHPPFQIDGNFGACSGIAQMFIQCEDGKIHILPALPTKFKSGKVQGLKAKGNVTVDILWKDGQLVSYSLESPVKQTVTVLTPIGEQQVYLDGNIPFVFKNN